MWQYIIVFLILAASVAYAAIRAYRSLKQAGQECYTACQGCELAKKCRKATKKD